MNVMSAVPADRENALLEMCKAKQGQYLPIWHGPGSWATTYSAEFRSAAKELYSLYREKGGHYQALRTMSERFRNAGIRSCRGCDMDINRVEYLFKVHLRRPS